MFQDNMVMWSWTIRRSQNLTKAWSSARDSQSNDESIEGMAGMGLIEAVETINTSCSKINI